MKKLLILQFLAVLTAVALLPPAVAETRIGVVFTPDEVRIITSWYRENGGEPRARGKGHRKAGGLPPGIARNLARGKALPPGIARQHLPAGLSDALPTPPRGFERVVIDGRVLLVEVATQVIHDVLTDLVLK